MGLIKCPDCGLMCSDQAITCIHCGRPLDKGNLKENPDTKNILNVDAIIAPRLKAGYFGPIFWMSVFSLIATTFLVVGLALVTLEEFAGGITCIVSALPFGLFIFLCTLPMKSRRRNNKNNKPVILYKADTDSFEINNLDKEPFYIPRNSVVSYDLDTVSYIYYRNKNGNVVKARMAYVKVDKYLKSTFKKYIKK